MKNYSKILLLTFTSFIGTAAMADKPVPPEAAAAAEAQQAALDYQHEQEQKENSVHE